MIHGKHCLLTEKKEFIMQQYRDFPLCLFVCLSVFVFLSFSFFRSFSFSKNYRRFFIFFWHVDRPLSELAIR